MIMKMVVAVVKYGQKLLVWHCIYSDALDSFYSTVLFTMKNLDKTHKKDLFQVLLNKYTAADRQLPYGEKNLILIFQIAFLHLIAFCSRLDDLSTALF